VFSPSCRRIYRSPLGWYLPGHPELVWRRSLRGFLTRFAIVQVSDSRAWLSRYDVVAAQVFPYYDHPILGRSRGEVIVARFRRPTRIRGALFYRRT